MKGYSMMSSGMKQSQQAIYNETLELLDEIRSTAWLADGMVEHGYAGARGFFCGKWLLTTLRRTQSITMLALALRLR
jgi:hypothetical protein